VKKVYISADIEGVCGIADWKETDLSDPQGAYFRAQMTREVRAACEGAKAAGAVEIFVKDAHSSGRNIDPSMLPEDVRIMRAWTRNPYSMMAGIDASFDAAMFIGYHSGGGSNGHPLAHTMDRENLRILVNGEEASEFLINAYTAASFGVPVVLVSGDRQLCERVSTFNPSIQTVPVHEGLGNATIAIHPALAVARIGEAASLALRGDPASCLSRLPDRFEVTIDFKEHFKAYRGSFYPGASQAGPKAISFACTEWFDVLRLFSFVL
jgi:D-amino peptidase